MNRVVVTGLGVISPVGNDVKDFWSSLAAGKCGIAPITRFDTADFKAKVAAEVKDFDPAAYEIDKTTIRRTDLYAQYALAAALAALGVLLYGFRDRTLSDEAREALIFGGPERR